MNKELAKIIFLMNIKAKADKKIKAMQKACRHGTCLSISEDRVRCIKCNKIIKK
jgi:hypothetical protein